MLDKWFFSVSAMNIIWWKHPSDRLHWIYPWKFCHGVELFEDLSVMRNRWKRRIKHKWLTFCSCRLSSCTIPAPYMHSEIIHVVPISLCYVLSVFSYFFGTHATLSIIWRQKNGFKCPANYMYFPIWNFLTNFWTWLIFDSYIVIQLVEHVTIFNGRRSEFQSGPICFFSSYRKLIRTVLLSSSYFGPRFLASL
jgi:hypothetical protein